jgi:lipoyl(octanoyl) transferase
MQQVNFFDLGTINFKDSWNLQEKLLASIVDNKVLNRTREDSEKINSQHYLLFCEHPHVYTLGKSGDESNLLADEKLLIKKGAEFFKINRGGDITYHGPGQLVGYPIFDLDYFFNDIHQYLRLLEEAVILTCNDYNLTAGRIPGLTGVWIDPTDKIKSRKICAFGVRCSRWVTMHGFAFNVNTDLDYFNQIVPCGIVDRGVTSLEKELGKEINIEEVKIKLLLHLSELFPFSIVSKPIDELLNHELIISNTTI